MIFPNNPFIYYKKNEEFDHKYWTVEFIYAKKRKKLLNKLFFFSINKMFAYLIDNKKLNLSFTATNLIDGHKKTIETKTYRQTLLTSTFRSSNHNNNQRKNWQAVMIIVVIFFFLLFFLFMSNTSPMVIVPYIFIKPKIPKTNDKMSVVIKEKKKDDRIYFRLL